MLDLRNILYEESNRIGTGKEGTSAMTIEIEVKGEDIETAIRFFKRIVLKDGIHNEIKRREALPNKGDRRKEKMREAARRRLQREKKRQWKRRECAFHSSEFSLA